MFNQGLYFLKPGLKSSVIPPSKSSKKRNAKLSSYINGYIWKIANADKLYPNLSFLYSTRSKKSYMRNNQELVEGFIVSFI